MINKDSAEYKTVVNLYKDGKITAQERNKLLAALGFVDDGQKTVTYRVDGMTELGAEQVVAAAERVEGVTSVTTDLDEKHIAVTGDFDAGKVIEAIKAEGYLCRAVDIEEHSDSADIFAHTPTVENDASEKTLSEVLSGLGDKISRSVQAGLKTAGSAIDYAGSKIKTAASGVVSTVQSAMGGTVIKRQGKKYGVPYDSLNVSVVYKRGVNKKISFKESAGEPEKLKAQCRTYMSDMAYEKTAKILDEKFTGSFKYVCGEDVLKINIEP